MPRIQYGVQQVNIADGFADDCDELIHRCTKVDVLNYETFCGHFKDMEFASLYQGRTSNAEIAELSEEVLQIAKYYMVLDTSNFEESVAGLFLVYALLNLQPYPKFAALRIIPEDVPAIAHIEMVARRQKRLDVLYVLGAVLAAGPAHCHAAQRERGLESSIRKYLEGFCSIDTQGVRPKGVYYRQNEELDIIRELSAICKRYSAAKDNIREYKKLRLSYSNDNLANDLSKSLKSLINGTTEEPEDESPPESYNVRQEIRQRAMKSTVSQMKHLVGVDLLPETSQKQEDIPSISKSPMKRSASKGKADCKSKTKRRHVDSSSSSDAESSDENNDWCKKKHERSPAVSTLKTDAKTEPISEDTPLHIDDLPPLVTTESEGKVVEIEIIDQLKTPKKRGRKKKVQGTPEKKTEFKRPLRMSPRIMKMEKRELKKPILKSKFKKMGMLPVANFEEAE